MARYAALEPRYEFAAHKGYPTARHREILARYGPSPIHRRSFSSVRAAAGPHPGPQHARDDATSTRTPPRAP